MEPKETLIQKLEKFKVIVSIAVIIVPLIGTSIYYVVEQTHRASRFVEKLQGVDAAELANTLDWLELEILRIRYAELEKQKENMTTALKYVEDSVRKTLEEQIKFVTNGMKDNMDRQDEILKAYRERARKKS